MWPIYITWDVHHWDDVLFIHPTLHCITPTCEYILVMCDYILLLSIAEKSISIFLIIGVLILTDHDQVYEFHHGDDLSQGVAIRSLHMMALDYRISKI